MRISLFTVSLEVGGAERDGKVRLRAADVDQQGTGFVQRDGIGRVQNNHALAKGDDIRHRHMLLVLALYHDGGSADPSG